MHEENALIITYNNYGITNINIDYLCEIMIRNGEP